MLSLNINLRIKTTERRVSSSFI